MWASLSSIQVIGVPSEGAHEGVQGGDGDDSLSVILDTVRGHDGEEVVDRDSPPHTTSMSV